MKKPTNKQQLQLHCRIGSLEKIVLIFNFTGFLHCRIGSLEIAGAIHIAEIKLHCRIGSLEIFKIV